MISEERQAALSAVAIRLAKVWAHAGTIDGFSESEIPRDRPEAYFAQDQMAELIGQPCTGWKIGATSVKMREMEGHEDIIPGRLFPSTTHFANNLTLAIGGCPNTRVETEFGFRLLQDLPLREAEWTAEEITPHMLLHPALEVIGNRFNKHDVDPATLSRMGIADNGGGVAGVFGNPVEDWQQVDFRNHPVSFIVDGGPPSENFLGEMRCEPAQAIADLANLLAARGLSLHKDAMLLTGAATVPQPVGQGSSLVADFGALGRIEMNFT